MATISQQNNLPNRSRAGYKSLYTNNGEITVGHPGAFW